MEGPALRPGLVVDTEPFEDRAAELTVILVVLDRRRPELADLPDADVTVLAVSSGSATAEDLAGVAVAAYDHGSPIDGILIADPDPADRTTGRLSQHERNQRVTLPTRLTGGSSAGGVRECHGYPEVVAMIDPSWRVDEPDPGDPVDVGAPQGGPVSLHFLLSALRRRRVFVVASLVVGGVLGAVYFAAVPAQREATVQLLLSHDPTIGSSSAIATDMSLLRTRSVASAVIDDLGLDMTPEAFQQTVTAATPTDQIMVLTVSAPTAAESVERAGRLAVDFLAFRNTQVAAQSTSLAGGYGDKLATLKVQSDELRTQYDALLSAGHTSQATDLLGQLTSLDSETQALQQKADDVTLRTDSVVASSHVVDQASVVPESSLGRLLLAIASGVLIGAALAIGVVLFVAVTSDRLWRRDEVATALGVPVRYSVGKIQPRRWVPWSVRARRETNLAVLVRGLARALHATDQRRPRLTVVPVGCTDDALRAVVALGQVAHAAGLKPFLVDLTDAGTLSAAVARASSTSDHDERQEDARGLPSSWCALASAWPGRGLARIRGRGTA